MILLPLFLISLLLSATASINSTELTQIIKNEKIIIQQLQNINNAIDTLSQNHVDMIKVMRSPGWQALERLINNDTSVSIQHK